MKKTYLLGAEALVSVVILFLVSVRLESVPPLWWDEGWTLSVARNWIGDGPLPKVISRALGTPWIGSGPYANWEHLYSLSAIWCWCFSGPHGWGFIYTGELGGHLLSWPPAL